MLLLDGVKLFVSNANTKMVNMKMMLNIKDLSLMNKDGRLLSKPLQNANLDLKQLNHLMLVLIILIQSQVSR